MLNAEIEIVQEIARAIAREEIALALKSKDKPAPDPEPVKADHKKGGK